MRVPIDIRWAAALLSLFGAVTLWFNIVDFYNHHFFDRGIIVFSDNVIRSGFIAILLWLIYAPGAAAVAILTGQAHSGLTGTEKGVVAFAIGAAIWHVVMLILGVAGLYYRAVMIVLCAAVLLLSSRHFGATIGAARQAIYRQLGEKPRQLNTATAVGILFFVVCAAWLLLVRGLYPGGSGDYYTHYFPYYMDVIKNHSLKPNEVWYHYYYSKGYGLFFLGMLLTDPEAPELVTFGFVLAASVGLIALGQRIAPRTLWPWWLAMLYLAFNIISLDVRFGGGDFQKDHEQVSALIALAAVALCMAKLESPRIWLTAAAASGIAVAIIAQPMGVIIGVYFMLLAAWSAARRHWRQMRQYGLAGIAIGTTVGALLVLNYWATGLFSDELFGLMLRFADIARLDRWGVVPQLPIIAWIRDIYRTGLPLWQPGVWPIVSIFLRLDTLWVVLATAAAAFGYGIARTVALRAQRRRLAPRAAIASTMSATIAVEIGAMVAVLTLISLAVGWDQPVSFLRTSTFFFPLLLMLATSVCCWALAGMPTPWRSTMDRTLPVLLFAGTVFLWSANADWIRRAEAATGHSLRFFYRQL